MFKPVPGNVSFPDLEAEIGRFWKERRIYEKSLDGRAGAEPFVFYEGPPTANGMPHPGHCLTRAIKDLFPRYRTMRGQRCERKAGWDTHGLPVEVEVCKELGIHSKEEIEAYGVEPFIHRCQESVWRYMQEWERLTERLGFWIHLDEAYVTYHQSYIESVWWALKNFFDRGLLYQGHKIVWWWAQGGTALSSGEVGQGYREVADPSVFVKFPLLDDEGNETDTSLLVWTTTPWTLPSNQFVAVNPLLPYIKLPDPYFPNRKVIVANVLRSAILTGTPFKTFHEYVAGLFPDAEIDPSLPYRRLKDRELEKANVAQEELIRDLLRQEWIAGEALIGKRYRPPFDCYYKELGDVKTFIEKPGQTTYSIAQGDEQRHIAWRIVEGEFVDTSAGTGIVHIAPAFGEVDFEVLIQERRKFSSGNRSGPELINAVAPNGTFTDEGPEYCRGRWVKDCDSDIIRDLDERGLLFNKRGDQYHHDYPFCWRAEEDPLIQYPRESWFIRTTAYKEQMLENNSRINWLPEHIKTGRFGNFLDTNVDWALSRERYWGTPLPIWVCEETGYMEAVASYQELLEKPGVTGTEVWDEAKRKKPELPDDLRVHKPYIDAITYDSPKAPGKRMRRVPEVIDCWFDSGAMPFAQWGYPHQGRDQFDSQFPADFISEALDQTRGWFYSLLAISTLLFSESSADTESSFNRDPTRSASNPQSEIPNPQSFPHPYRNCIVLGLMLSEWYESKDGKSVFLAEDVARQALGEGKYVHRVGKMSKSKRNYREPAEIFDVYGADALRWYFFANQPPWNSIIYSEQAIKESIPRFLLTLWNCYSFFVIYANSDDHFDPGERLDGEAGQLTSEQLSRGKGYRPMSERRELDRWVLSELNRTAAGVVERMDAYDNYGACRLLDAFVDNLSNWYVRRSRPRFWSQDYDSPDKLDAYWTLYECLLTTSKLAAPFTPFVAETMWQNLAGVFGGRAVESVHLCDFPTGDRSLIDETLSEQMELGRLVSSLGREARAKAQLKVRQPLAKVEVILADPNHQPWLESHRAVIADELNVKQVEFSDEPEKYIDHQVVPDFKKLGPRLGKLMPKVKKWLGEQSASDLLANLRAGGKIDCEIDGEAVELTPEEIEIRIQAKEGWTTANDRGCVVVLATELTDELIQEGFAREIVRAVQDIRKEKQCQYTDRIALGFVTDSADLKAAVAAFGDYIKSETLGAEMQDAPLPGVEPIEVKIAGQPLRIYLQVLLTPDAKS